MGSSGVEAVDRKQKIRDRYKGVDASELEAIPAKAVEGFGESTSVRRVAAYVRVSTDNDEQTSSYELQKNYYTEYIKAQPGWEFVGIYDDEGISGTSLEHRKGMQQLIEDCKAEKIDLVLTKSIARFARNIVDCLSVIETLKNLDPPVGVKFEADNIYTLDSNGRMILTILASVAEEESHSKSIIMNGYKVYGADGCQITTEAAAEILTEIEKLDIFADVRTSGFEAGVANGSIQYIPDEVYTAFVEQVKAQSVLFGEKVNKNAAIVYSPLNGTGLKPVTRTLKEMGYTNITVVKEQELPDGNFPTCPYPNPEIKEAMALGMEYAKKCNADLLLATDPDCDRVGIAVKNKAGEYELLTGNQTGMLLDYICSQRVKHGKMPADPVMVKTIVTMDMGEQIATHYGLRTINVLTGFKFIGEQIGKLEQQGRADSYVFGFEESYGYLTGSYVRDKDGVDGAYMICEMFSYYATKGISLLDKLEELYKIYGYCLNTLHSYEFDGSAGFAKMQRIMQAFRGGIKEFGGKKVVKLLDYAPGLDGLPKSDVLKFLLEDNCSIVVRPSGTEPKLKTYISISAENKETAEKIEAEICKSAEEYLK